TGVTYDEMVARYEADFGETPPAAFHAHTYDATMLLLSAIKAVAVVDGDGVMWVDRNALRRELESTTNFAGMIGTLECDDFGDCGSQTIGIIEHLDPSDPAESKKNFVYSFSPTG
ncbi:MAG: ABC transporter substrate-binding protein, partial [Acidimicrobiia bacterium]